MSQGRFLDVLLCGILSLATPMLDGCCRKSKTDTKTSTGPTGVSAGTTGETVTIPNAGVQFNAPGGWTRTPFGDWIKYLSPDKYAALAFVTFNKPGESTRRISEMVRLLDMASPPDWGARKVGTLGPNSLKANIGDGPCTLNGGDPCYFEYATVDTGNSNQLLIVYIVNTAKGKQHKDNASASIRSLRKM
ncbi:MAG: hypothetical protein RMJ98_20085 [Myxococcales bacterium]|nr:hypothetical protein [Polyangiaceae bacterium]MDW8251601.1 hypothetical protein [Myxococcales bacterium]